MHGYMIAGPLLAWLTAVPLAWKWQLGVRRTVLIIGALAVLSDVVVATVEPGFAVSEWSAAAAVWVLTVGAAFLLLAYRFYRDPDRQAPDRDDVVVSPADGEVIYIRRSQAGKLPVSNKHGRAYALTELTKTPLHSADSVVVGIAMNFSDVHVNRAPVAGRVVVRQHFPGRFGSLRDPEMVFENERATTVIDGSRVQIAVVQIASRLVRQIAVFLREGDRVALGQRLGVIRLGSQVDVVLPARDDLRITARVGERVRAGESIIAVHEAAGVRREQTNSIVRERSDRPAGALVFGEHIRGLALVRSLGRRGIPVWTLEAEGECMASASRYCARSHRWPDASDSERLEYLLALAARYELEGWTLFPTSDETTAFCARHHAELSRRFRLPVPPWEVVQWAYDKRLTYRLAADLGIDQPATFFPKNREELSKLELSYPVVLKPAFKKELNAFTRDKAWRVGDPRSLAARYDEACTLVDADVVMVQQMVPGAGDTQFSFGAVCVDGCTVASVTARRTRQYPVEFGHSSSFVETIEQPAVEDAARRLLAAMRYTGLAEVEFKYDRTDGRYKLLEVNPRVWTWHALGRRAGVDFPYELWRLVHGERVDEHRGRAGTKWVRMSTDLAAAWSEIVRGRLSPSAYVRSLVGPLEFATFTLDDPLPAFGAVSRVACSQWKRWRSASSARVLERVERPVISEKPA
jgi:phosphatidylserine decarboxylase precursor-related protein